MKKKIIPLLVTLVFSMGIPMTVMAAEEPFRPDPWPISVMPENLYSSIWVGDCIILDTDSYTYEVISGTENAEIDLTEETLRFMDEGTTEVKVSPKDDLSTSETYTFTISPAEEAYVEYQIPQSVKVGYTVGSTANTEADAEYAYIYYNCLLGEERYGGMTSMRDLYSYGFVAQGWLDPFYPNAETRTVTGWWNMTFTRPGTAYIDIEDEGNEPYAITIEEPVISTNLPKRVQSGTKMQMTTSLDNTELENKKIAEIKDRSIYDTKAALGYQPKVEIVSGAELVERENGDYSNILSSSEDITFTGEGIVTFKVTYEMLPFENVESGESVAVSNEVYYSPEATFTVEVTSDLTSGIKVTDKTGDMITVDTSGLNLNEICEDNDLDLTKNDVEIIVSQGEVIEENSARLEQVANENGYAVKTLNEIQMSLFSDGNKIADITDNFGTIKLNLYVGEEYTGQKAVVYQLHNGTEIITHDGLVVNEDGTVSITTDKLSTFAVAVEDTKENETPEVSAPSTPTDSDSPSASSTSDVQNTNSTTKSVQTGDDINLSLWILLCLGSVGTIIALMKRKAFKR